MRILVCSQKLSVGGAVVTALDLATQLHHIGHEVHIFAEDGPLASIVADRGFPYHEAPALDAPKRRWPSPSTARALRRVTKEVAPDVVHSYEWPACLDALVGPYLLDGVPLVASVMAMRVPRFMPRHVPLVVGTRVLHDELHRQGYPQVSLVEPPVDVQADRPDHPTSFRADHGIPDGALVLAIISRLDSLKAESAHQAIDAVEGLAARTDVRLVIAGDGSASDDLAARADAVNRRLGREVVVMVGMLADPRGAYAASDVILGMGGSALRGLAFGKALVVLGTRGYAELFTPETSGEFLVQGFWGLGAGRSSAEHLSEQLGCLVDDPARRAELGQFGRRFVSERFGLEQAAARLEPVLHDAIAQAPPGSRRRAEVVATMTRLSAVRAQDVARRSARLVRGRSAPDAEL